VNDAWPELVRGWELARHGHVENYRKRLANKVTVFATWDAEPGTGTVEARVESFGPGRTLTRGRKDFRDKEAFWTAAHCVVEIAANLPSLDAGQESPADSVLFDTVAGTVAAEPDSTGEPGAELTFTLLSGRTVTLVLSDDQAHDLTRRIDGLDKHVWSEQRQEPEDQPTSAHVEVPDVAEVHSGPDTGHDVVTLLDTQFDITEDHLMAHVDWSALIVVGDPAVTTLINRAAELETALHPRWYPVTVDRPGEQWVVLRRTGLIYDAG
jgi:hypothetical protein